MKSALHKELDDINEANEKLTILLYGDSALVLKGGEDEEQV